MRGSIGVHCGAVRGVIPGRRSRVVHRGAVKRRQIRRGRHRAAGRERRRQGFGGGGIHGAGLRQKAGIDVGVDVVKRAMPGSVRRHLRRGGCVGGCVGGCGGVGVGGGIHGFEEEEEEEEGKKMAVVSVEKTRLELFSSLSLSLKQCPG